MRGGFKGTLGHLWGPLPGVPCVACQFTEMVMSCFTVFFNCHIDLKMLPMYVDSKRCPVLWRLIFTPCQ